MIVLFPVVFEIMYSKVEKSPINGWPRLAVTHTWPTRELLSHLLLLLFYYIVFSWAFCLQPHEIG